MAPDIGRIGKTAYRVFEGPKMTVVMPYAPEAGNWFDVVVLPKPEHVEAFLNAAAGLKPDGPSSDYPGAVGTVRVTLASSGKNFAILQYAQSHFKKRGGAGYLPPKLAREYSNWRLQALEHAIRTLVVEHGYTLSVSKATVRNLPHRTLDESAVRAPVEEELETAARRIGARHTEGKFCIEISRG